MNLDDLLPTAMDLKKKIALEESAKAAEEMRRRSEADAEKKALIDQLTKPSGGHGSISVDKIQALVISDMQTKDICDGLMKHYCFS